MFRAQFSTTVDGVAELEEVPPILPTEWMPEGSSPDAALTDRKHVANRSFFVSVICNNFPLQRTRAGVVNYFFEMSEKIHAEGGAAAARTTARTTDDRRIVEKRNKQQQPPAGSKKLLVL